MTSEPKDMSKAWKQELGDPHAQFKQQNKIL